jgi:zinc protease
MDSTVTIRGSDVIRVVVTLLCAPACPLHGQMSPATLHDVDGVKLIHREIPGSRVFAAHVYLLGGPTRSGDSLAGIEPLFLNTAERGTERYPGSASREAMSRLGGRTFVSAAFDWTVYGLTGLSEDLPALWDIFVDRLVSPELRSDATEQERERSAARRRATLDDPADRATALAAAHAFRGHPYGIPPYGTPGTLAAIDRDALRSFRERHIVKSRLLVVIVGGVREAQAGDLVATGLGGLPVGDFEWTPPPVWSADSTTVTVEERSIATNYVHGLFGGPSTTDEQYPAFEFAVALLSSFISAQIRSIGLSYSTGVAPVGAAASGGMIYLSSRRPGPAVAYLNLGLQFLKGAILNRSAIRQWGREAAYQYYAQNQSPGQQSDFLARSYLLRGSLQSVDEFVEELHDIDPVDVRRMAREYLRNIQWAFVGDPALLPEKGLRLY